MYSECGPPDAHSEMFFVARMALWAVPVVTGTNSFISLGGFLLLALCDVAAVTPFPEVWGFCRGAEFSTFNGGGHLL